METADIAGTRLKSDSGKGTEEREAVEIPQASWRIPK